MSTPKKTVFISSTFEDLADHRQAVWQVLNEFKLSIRGMEQFGARPDAPLATCLAEVEQSDVYVGLVAFRIGSIDSSTGKSFTQLEYEHAVELGKDVLIYLADEQNARVRYTDIDVDMKLRERLKAFKETLREKHTVDTFTEPDDLGDKLRRDLKRYFKPAAKETDKSVEEEFETTIDLVNTFQLLPKSVVGREALFRVTFRGIFPASRSLCKAFNLEYGNTIGSYVNIREPQLGPNQWVPFHEMYATGTRANEIIQLKSRKEPIDLYARLQFSEQDVHGIRAEFFGSTYWVDDDPDPGNPNEQYDPPEGKSILLFSKLPKRSTGE